MKRSVALTSVMATFEGARLRQTQGTADTRVARAGNDDAMWVHVRKTDGWPWL